MQNRFCAAPRPRWGHLLVQSASSAASAVSTERALKSISSSGGRSRRSGSLELKRITGGWCTIRQIAQSLNRSRRQQRLHWLHWLHWQGRSSRPCRHKTGQTRAPRVQSHRHWSCRTFSWPVGLNVILVRRHNGLSGSPTRTSLSFRML